MNKGGLGERPVKPPKPAMKMSVLPNLEPEINFPPPPPEMRSKSRFKFKFRKNKF